MAKVDEGTILLGKGVYLKKPVAEINSGGKGSRETSPSVILIFGWLGARLPHLLKYSKAYDDLYPQAAQIIVRSEATFFWSPKSAQQAYLRPVVEALELLGCLPPSTSPSKLVGEANIQPVIPYPTPRVLVHAFSNGGSWQLATLSGLLETRATTKWYTKLDSSALPPSAIIFDSCPGDGGVERTVRAFTSAIRSPTLRRLAVFFIRLLYFYQSLSIFRKKGPNMVDKMKDTINHPKVLPWFSAQTTKRLYLYSSQDDMIPPDEVEAHASKGRKEHGFVAKMERFEDSPHVSHSRIYPERYWAAVTSTWELAIATSEG